MDTRSNGWRAAVSSLKSVSGAASSLSSSVVTGLKAGLETFKHEPSDGKQLVTSVRFANLEYTSQARCCCRLSLDAVAQLSMVN